MSEATKLSQSYSSPRVFENTAAIQSARAEVGRILELPTGARYQASAIDEGSGLLMANGLYANLIADVLKRGDFGVGGFGVSLTDFHDIEVGGFYNLNSGAANQPATGFNWGAVCLPGSNENNLSVITAARNGQTLYYQSNVSGVWDTSWVEILTSGNTNLNTFGGLATNDILAHGSVRTATIAQVMLPISLVSAPTSITVTGTFSLIKPDFTVVASGVTPNEPIGAFSSNKVLFLTFVIAGGTANDPLMLQCTDATSKIVVNP